MRGSGRWQGQDRRGWLYALGALMAMAVLLTAGCGGSPDSGSATTAAVTIGEQRETAPRVGALAPDFTLLTLDGERLSLSQIRGSPVVLNFFATWCTPCQVEIPHLRRAYETKAAQGLKMVGIDLDESPAAVRRFADRFGLLYTIVIDRDGVIRAIKIGPFVTQDELMRHLARIGL